MERTNSHSHLQFIATLAFTLMKRANVWQRPVAERPPNQLENVMRGRAMMILASALLAGSLMATGAQARGGGGGGGGHMGGFGGGGHMGGFGGGHMGGFGGAHMGGFGGGHVGGFGGDHVGGHLGADHMAHMDHDHFGAGRRHFVGGYDYGLDCPYNPNYTSPTWPYTCTY